VGCASGCASGEKVSLRRNLDDLPAASRIFDLELEISNVSPVAIANGDCNNDTEVEVIKKQTFAHSIFLEFGTDHRVGLFQLIVKTASLRFIYLFQRRIAEIYIFIREKKKDIISQNGERSVEPTSV